MNITNKNKDQSEDSPTTFILDEIYQLIKKLGKGATSTVYLAKNLKDNKFYAIKKLVKGEKGRNAIESFNNEIKILTKLNETSKHPNIIGFIASKENGILKASDGSTSIISYIVLEYAVNGELFNYIYHPRTGFGETLARKVFRRVVNSVAFCHYNGIIHRDLKIENIVLDANWNLKIADFGYSGDIYGIDGRGGFNNYLGTLTYAAPEVLMKKPYIGSPADIYSCGIILFVLVTGDFPFKSAQLQDPLYRLFIENEYERFWEFTEKRFNNQRFSDGFKNLVNLMISFDPTQRPSLSEIKSNYWFNDDCGDESLLTAEFQKRKIQSNKMKVLKYVMGGANNNGKNNINNNLALNNHENSNILLFRSKNFVDDKENYKRIVPEFFYNKFENFEEIRFCNTNNPFIFKFVRSSIKEIIDFFFKVFPNEDKYKLKFSKKNLKFKIYVNEKPDNEFEDDLVVNFIISKMNTRDSVVELIKIGNNESQFKELVELIEINQDEKGL